MCIEPCLDSLHLARVYGIDVVEEGEREREREVNFFEPGAFFSEHSSVSSSLLLKIIKRFFGNLFLPQSDFQMLFVPFKRRQFQFGTPQFFS